MMNKFIYLITGNINDFYDDYKEKFFLNFLDLLDSMKSDDKEGNLKITLKSLHETKDYILNEGSTKRIYSSFESEIGMMSVLLKQNDLIDNLYIINPPVKLKESIYKSADNYYEEIYYPFKSYSNEKLLESYKFTEEKILGQPRAMKNIHSSLINHKNSNNIKVILLYGPSGVGKTESVKLVADRLFGKNTLTRIQMSMLNDAEGKNYMFGNEKHNKTFSEDLLARKSNFILFDEFDKCQSSLYNAFYQMFDESKYKDNHYEVDLKGTVIFCTTNFGSLKEIQNTLGKPIYSRIDMFIKYEEINIEHKFEYLKKVYDKQWNQFEHRHTIEKNKNELLEVLLSEPLQLLNMREINNLVETGINRVYFNELIKKSNISRYSI
ncbi:AAA family ATPase [Macrococcoides caseolyticum]|uniref:ATPase AAA-type core domain-containing protein n=1 Tax=Macrococcus caseolyticus (strain JCSC5402) TaxID=458233 RepID=B9E9N5_MACCJ|nr:AAA family ATPase [Macrococcus caseolyticus]MBQ5152473.1 AAA family ATPase [Macrococcus caseolyticus]MDJ1092093.1 AAA family ATPase [Macrococcus caseolyticus]RAI78790.1 AAA family ATPase [Macrococcus caseolyticus subsp. hominis]RKO15819.1 AAA family ATPase [Macrococcus caseolyticus]BAH16946.1 conserved hypothetical protein [Macrococcus caseolyticus JCSC5402]